MWQRWFVTWSCEQGGPFETTSEAEAFEEMERRRVSNVYVHLYCDTGRMDGTMQVWHRVLIWRRDKGCVLKSPEYLRMSLSQSSVSCW